MRPRRAVLAALAVLGLATGLAVAAVIATSSYTDLRGLIIGLVLLGGWGFIGAGLFAWARDPENRIGPVMVFTGFTWFAPAAASDNEVVFSVTVMLNSLFAAAIIHLLLAYPTGRLRTRADRWLTGLAYGITTLGVGLVYLVIDPVTDDCEGCPEFVFDVTDNNTVQSIAEPVINTAGLALLVSVLVTVFARWRAATRPQRRILGPIYSTGAFMLLMLSLSLSGDLLSLPESIGEAMFLLGAVSFTLLPFLFLGGLIRSRVLRAGAVTSLIARLAEAPEPGALRDALASALRDDSLELVYWIPGEERFVDMEGRAVTLPEPGSGRTVTKVEGEGDCVAAILHAEVADEDAGLIEAAGAAASLALENERLDAELRARLEELRASRTRIVEAGVAERRRLERDLHDGAQQRLVSLALNLRMARGKLRDDPDTAATLLDGSAAELDRALEELRELARGIHPAVLSDRGLDAALESLAVRAPLPVELTSVSDGLSDAVESAAYFVVAEALTNVAKYANASQARVAVERVNGQVVVEVADDGVGGADPGRGTGLRGLDDRICALNGWLEIESAPGSGTTVRAKIPCG